MEIVKMLLGGLSREDVLQLLLLRGLAATYAELGIKRDPVLTARELLIAIGNSWSGDLSDEEATAFRTAVAALDRIAQVSARDAGAPS